MEITKSEQQGKKKKVFQNERSLSTLWESIKHINILILEFGGEEG